MFAISPNLTRENAFSVTVKVCEELKNLNADFAFSKKYTESFSNICTNFCDDNVLYDSCDAVIAIGGDGTFIDCAKKASDVGKPILGINAGRVAFMAGLEPQELGLLKHLITKEYSVDKRMMLSVKVIENGKTTQLNNCLNDIFVGRAQHVNMVNLNVSCDSGTVGSYYADGVIVSTPTGSTAYSLSAGGPVIDPLIESLLLTPVCPHSLFPRPLIFRSESVLEIKNCSKTGEVFLFCDGGEGIPMQKDCSVMVQKADKTADFIRIKSDTFIDILNSKMRSN